MRKFFISLLVKWDGVIFFFKKGQGFWIGKLSSIITKGSVSIFLSSVFFLFCGLFSIGFIGSKYGVVELREVILINDAEEVVDEGFLADQILSSVVPDWERGEFDYERLSTLKPDCFLPQSSSGPFSMASKVSGGKLLDLVIFGISGSEKEKIIEDLTWCFVEEDWVFRGKGVFARVFVDEGLLLLAAGTGNGAERAVNSVIAEAGSKVQDIFRKLCSEGTIDAWCSTAVYQEVASDRVYSKPVEEIDDILPSEEVFVVDPVEPTPSPTPEESVVPIPVLE
jgi:hypothetical protein